MNLPASIRYGRLNESTAIQEFVKITGLEVNFCGFFIYKEAPFLGASPDGLVGQNSLVEVKCLYSIRDSDIKQSAKTNKNDLHYGPNAQDALPDLPEEEFKSNMAKKLAELTKEAGNSVEIERQTIGQHVNPLWLNIRRDRLTASNFGTIYRRRPSTSCHAIVQKLLYSISGKDEMNLPASIR
ncbi:hypothetical protein ILUMI_15197 [Ignelater luminosus]|uniref:YqaJ viral recombinase domain-containing protein n=1 Tax=Ignelater luminosus TaxID=2038154 RepID=A0A8K0CSS4_IGNLU|nr:hypothetical protein ILUMI_15197 [Ignelater luminosus]